MSREVQDAWADGMRPEIDLKDARHELFETIKVLPGGRALRRSTGANVGTALEIALTPVRALP